MTNEQPNHLGSAWNDPNQTNPNLQHSQQTGSTSWQQGGVSANSPQSLSDQQRHSNAPQQWQSSNQLVAVHDSYNRAPVGKIRGTGVGILLAIVTLGVYAIYWNCAVHSEMKKHTGQGVGGVGAFFLGCIPFVMTFMTPSEVGRLYVRQNRHAPVSAATGFWTLIPVVGAFLWFAQINGALNDYWRSMGAVEH